MFNRLYILLPIKKTIQVLSDSDILISIMYKIQYLYYYVCLGTVS